MPRGSKDYEVKPAVMRRGIPGKDEGFEKENFLNPALLTILCFIIFIHKMYEDMPCMHRILYVGKNSENYTFIMNTNGKYCIGVGISAKPMTT